MVREELIRICRLTTGNSSNTTPSYVELVDLMDDVMQLPQYPFASDDPGTQDVAYVVLRRLYGDESPAGSYTEGGTYQEADRFLEFLQLVHEGAPSEWAMSYLGSQVVSAG